MWQVFLVVLVLVGLCVLGLGVNVLFFKKDFPAYDVGSNEELRRRGIRCFKDEDADLHRKVCTAAQTDACKDCHLYTNHRQQP
ncbi:MAG: hypothetical protein IJK55_04640 [Bacteroidales bacterium]|nr:hypothetical protein [Bacteroidales bacterium]MBR4585505.1 hypothetical protein [Bacteroidales bacterium]